MFQRKEIGEITIRYHLEDVFKELTSQLNKMLN